MEKRINPLLVVVLHITHPYVSRHVQTALTTQVRILMSVKEKRINPLLVVVLIIVLMIASLNKLTYLCSMSTPKHNSKELRVFLTEYHKIKHQLSRVLDFQAVVVVNQVLNKVPFQAHRICAPHM